MKILTIAKLKDTALMLPPSVFISLMEASTAAMEQHKKEGKIHHAYYAPGSDQIIVMLNYDSADQWAKDQTMIPILRYCDFESYPLADYDQYVKDALEMAKAAAAKMPGATR